MARIAVVDLDTGSVRAGLTPNPQRGDGEAVIVSLAGEEATARRAECANGRLVVNVADRPFKVWRVKGRRTLVLTGYGPGEEEFDTSNGPYEVTIEPKAAR